MKVARYRESSLVKLEKHLHSPGSQSAAGRVATFDELKVTGFDERREHEYRLYNSCRTDITDRIAAARLKLVLIDVRPCTRRIITAKLIS